MQNSFSGSSPLVIVGASTRAAAYSALRAGFAPICADLFADADLRDVADVIAVPRYPLGITRGVSQTPGNAPVMYTGALENHPRLVGRFSIGRTLWGNPETILRRIRNPLAVHDALSDAGLPALEVRPENDPPPGDGSWLRKPLHSAAGRGVFVWDAVAEAASFGEPRKLAASATELGVGSRVAQPSSSPERVPERRLPTPSRSRGHFYFQRYQTGLPCSALYLASRRESLLVGVAAQQIGLPHLPFGWSGAIAPWPVSDAARQSLESLGRSLAERFALIGLFGVDFVLDGETPWLVEVNPRYTSTVELFELALRQPLIAWHVAACQGAPVAGFGGQTARTGGQFVGKQVLYARERVRVADATGWIAAPGGYIIPTVADIPPPGQVIDPGQPICTVFASAEMAAACQTALEERADWFLQRYGEPLPVQRQP